jgi:hypothetical protein
MTTGTGLASEIEKDAVRDPLKIRRQLALMILVANEERILS